MPSFADRLAAARAATSCKICSKSVYPADPQLNLDGSLFHKACCKCADCGCQITLSNFAKNETSQCTTLLCKTHYFQRFNKGGGNYLGDEKYHTKSNRCAMITFQGVKISESPSPSQGKLRNHSFGSVASSPRSTQGTPHHAGSLPSVPERSPSESVQSTINLFNSRSKPSPSSSPRSPTSPLQAPSAPPQPPSTPPPPLPTPPKH